MYTPFTVQVIQLCSSWDQYSTITAKERVTEEHNTENSKFSATGARFAVSTDTSYLVP